MPNDKMLHAGRPVEEDGNLDPFPLLLNHPVSPKNNHLEEFLALGGI